MSKLLEVCLTDIPNADIASLKEPKFVADLIRKAGVEGDGPAYGYVEQNDSVPTGTGIFQLPDELAHFLVYMSDKGIKSFLDVGTWSGATVCFMTAYLLRFEPELVVLTIDPNPRLVPEFDELIAKLPIEGWRCTTADWVVWRLEGDKPLMPARAARFVYDLVFIDANHDYEAVKADYERVGQYARFCGFHDIDDRWVKKNCQGGGVPTFWNELKAQAKAITTHVPFGTISVNNPVMTGKELLEFKYHPGRPEADIFGIGVVIR